MAPHRSRTFKPLITDLDELKQVLSHPYLLLVGSALSGKSTPRLPMARDLITRVLLQAADRLANGSYADQLLSKYARSLCYGQYKAILDSTKFEEFLWQVEVAAGRESLDNLIQAVYACSHNQFGPNQRAVSCLLQSRKCLACLTTNFDNSIELSFPRLAVYDHPTIPLALPLDSEPPMLLKLHGDAQRRTSVATSKQLSFARMLATHNYLRRILVGTTILVAGYSGFGDTDIAPHLAWLSENHTRFVWGVRTKDSDVPEFASARFLCNLDEVDSRNMLVALALSEGCGVDSDGIDHQTDATLNQWCRDQTALALARIILLTMYGQLGRPIVHVMQFAPYPLLTSGHAFDHGLVCLQVSAYDSAMASFQHAALSPDIGPIDRIRAIVAIGFTQWRLGKLDEALDTLSPLHSLTFSTTSEAELDELANGLRLFVEITRDRLLLLPSITARKAFCAARSVDEITSRLRTILPVDIGADILTRAVLFHIRHLIADPIDATEVKALFDLATHSCMWGAAEAIARLLVCVSFTQGLRALVEVDRRLISRRQWNQVRKSIAAFIHALTGQRFPLVLSILDGPIFARIAIPIRELLYRRFCERRWREYMVAASIPR